MERMGFLAIWVQWIESTIWYPTVLTFGAVSIAFIGMNDAHDMTLASNKMYTLVVVLIIYWLATFISLKGLSWVGKVAKVGGIVGTIICCLVDYLRYRVPGFRRSFQHGLPQQFLP